MAQGPGKYDEAASQVRKTTGARAVIVIVIGGRDGSGFSVQAEEGVVLNIQEILRNVADQIEQDVE
jgi:hypothetical protein